jgi:hypothetical protein
LKVTIAARGADRPRDDIGNPQQNFAVQIVDYGDPYMDMLSIFLWMNDLFGAESFSASQVREFVQRLVQRLLTYPDLVNQTKVNSKKQFMESQDFQAAVTEAVVDNQEAHNTMADYFFSDGPGISAVIMALADAFYEAAIDQRTDV